MKKNAISLNRKVSDITNDLVNDNVTLLDANIEATQKLTDAEKLAELLKRTEKIITANTVSKHSIYKKDILKLFSNRESSARNKIRNIELNLSKAVTADDKTKSKSLEQSKADLIDFYSLVLINTKNYKSERKNKADEQILTDAYNLCFNAK